MKLNNPRRLDLLFKLAQWVVELVIMYMNANANIFLKMKCKSYIVAAHPPLHPWAPIKILDTYLSS